MTDMKITPASDDEIARTRDNTKKYRAWAPPDLMLALIARIDAERKRADELQIVLQVIVYAVDDGQHRDDDSLKFPCAIDDARAAIAKAKESK